MFSALFEDYPKSEQWDAYLNLREDAPSRIGSC